MIPAFLSDYIKKAQAKNLTNKQIRTNLLAEGWTPDMVNEGLQNSTPSSNLEAPRPTLAPHTSMWDAFEHVLLFISLYTLATSAALSIHLFIDRFLPGINTSKISFVYDTFSLTLMRGYTASLIVSYPLFAFLFLHITKRTQSNPDLRNLKSRKILIYLTLILTFLFMIGNIIGLVFTFLGGNVTFNFLLHFVTTIGVSGIIFGYYLIQVKADRLYA